MAQNKPAQRAKRNLAILFGVILLAVIAAVVIGQVKQKQREERMANYSTATPEPADVVEYGTLVCDDCKAANIDINVWTHPDRSGIAFSVPSGTRVQITDTQVYDGIRYYKVKYGGKSGWIRNIFVEKD